MVCLRNWGVMNQQVVNGGEGVKSEGGHALTVIPVLSTRIVDRGEFIDSQAIPFQILVTPPWHGDDQWWTPDYRLVLSESGSVHAVTVYVSSLSLTSVTSIFRVGTTSDFFVLFIHSWWIAKSNIDIKSKKIKKELSLYHTRKRSYG